MNNSIPGYPYTFTVRTEGNIKMPVGFRPLARKSFTHGRPDLCDDPCEPYETTREHGSGNYYAVMDTQPIKSENGIVWMRVYKEGVDPQVGVIFVDGWRWDHPSEGCPEEWI